MGLKMTTESGKNGSILVKSYSSDKEINKILSAVKKKGWKITKGSSNHIKVYPPTGRIVVLPSTPRSYDGVKDSIRELNEAGLEFKL